MLTRKPMATERVRWPDWAPGRFATVVRTPDTGENLCWIQEGDAKPEPFIWRFRDGLNVLAEIVDAEHGTTAEAWQAAQAIISDGNGEQCGWSYERRLGAARIGDPFAFMAMASSMSGWLDTHEAPRLTAEEISQTARYLRDYYAEHLAEISALTDRR
jgi:hypothetical protein